MNWTIVETSPTTRRIEAGERSFWMGFTDDIVVRSPSRIPEVASTCAPRCATGAAILGQTPLASAPTYLAALHESEKPGNQQGGPRV
jgi:hypothetical protein